MTFEQLSEAILNGTLDEPSDGFAHSDAQNESDSGNSLTHYTVQDQSYGNSLTHYGVLGMKWGVRKDRKRKGETDQQYKDRLDRESRERQQKRDISARKKEQKRTIRAQKAEKKRVLRSQERTEKARAKAQLDVKKAELRAQQKREESQRKAQSDREKRLIRENQRQEAKREQENKSRKEKKSKKSKLVGSEKTMTDEELQAAIQRLRNEREYKNLKKKPGPMSNPLVKTAVKVGGTIVTQQLIKRANMEIDNYMNERSEKKKQAAEDAKAAAMDAVKAYNRMYENAYSKAYKKASPTSYTSDHYRSTAQKVKAKKVKMNTQRSYDDIRASAIDLDYTDLFSTPIYYLTDGKKR